MVIRNTPKEQDKYIIVQNDDIIHELSTRGIFPKYINNQQAYFEKKDITLDVINNIIYKGVQK